MITDKVQRTLESIKYSISSSSTAAAVSAVSLRRSLDP